MSALLASACSWRQQTQKQATDAAPRHSWRAERRQMQCLSVVEALQHGHGPGTRRPVLTMAATKQRPRAPPSSESAPGKAALSREAHKIFDQADIICRSGRGGDGEVMEKGKGRMVRNFKYKPGRGMPKQIWLAASDPADGEAGADVALVVDTAVDNLLHLHDRAVWTARKGANGNPEDGSGAPKRRERVQKRAPTLKVPVPLGTVVKDKKGKLLAELLQVGDSYCVCTGGLAGRGTVAPGKSEAKAPSKQERALSASGVEVLEVEDPNWKADSHGGAGEERRVTLQLRVVADAGFVGLPNVGKSSLLACMTRARPEVAAYPFTTLMPNLGVMATQGEGALAEEQRSTLVDLPGLIEGAASGRGLGRMFLRHLARTRVLVHVVDAAAENPAADFWAVREELRLYNAEYCARPCVVALNKMDLPDAAELREEIEDEVKAMAASLTREHPDAHAPPVAVLPVSAQSGEGVAALMAEIADALHDADAVEGADWADDVVDWDTSLPEESDGFPAEGQAPPDELEDAWRS